LSHDATIQNIPLMSSKKNNNKKQNKTFLTFRNKIHENQDWMEKKLDNLITAMIMPKGWMKNFEHRG